MSQKTENKQGQVETTGHVWDGDLREYNNPLPRWWLWAFYMTIVFAVVYWILYPAWPYGDSYTKGINTVEYTVENEQGEEVTVSEAWNTRALFTRDMQSSPSALAQEEWVGKVKDMSFEEIEQDPDTLQFAMSMGNYTFGDFCAACHGSGGQGKIGQYPNLADNAWLYGNSYETIVNKINNGIQGMMPAQNVADDQIDDLAKYVLSLSGQAEISGEAASRGKQAFASCAGCHGAEGKGNEAMGALNLADAIWGVADVPGCGDDTACKIGEIKHVVNNGIQRQMPAFGDRLSETQARMLAIYVRQMGGN
ncbi:cytochrome-c oxidase, cbb3-type subunit III [Guyparkeria halopsychrophila]|uniref:cytochrome-c oxidase, cbb3-type subunit III n=1 Tax=Guyparkeria halopsychrophila TaxID=3139421 RepID=UPI0037C8EC9D